jgi:hypothetical protein
MHLKSGSICQYLKGNPEGARCTVADNFIRLMEDGDIRLCMNKRHEACSYYMSALRAAVLRAAEPDAALGAS